jgi:hypothetical protein
VQLGFVALAAGLLGVGGVLVSGGVAHADDPTWAVTGTLTDASTAAPLEGLLVELYPAADPTSIGSAVSNADGSYEVDFTPTAATGDYTIEINRSPSAGSTGLSYVHEWLGHAGTQSAATTFPLSADAPVAVADDALTAAATVSGTVTDENGDPVAGANIQISPPGASPNAWSGEHTTSDSAGAYTLSQVRANDTVLRVSATDADASHQRTDAQVFYNPRYWPGVDDPADAAAVSTQPGDILDGIDVVLTREPAIHQLLVDGDDAAIPCVAFTPYLLDPASGRYQAQRSGQFSTGSDGYLNFAMPPGSTYKILYFDTLASNDPLCPDAPLVRTQPFQSQWYGGDSLATATALHADGESGQTSLPPLTLQPFTGPIALAGTPMIVTDTVHPAKVYLSGVAVSPGDASLSYQWLRDDSPIDGATDSWHHLGAADTGTTLEAEITATRSGYESQTFLSAPLNLRGSFTTTPLPTVSGTPSVGSTLVADAGTWLPTPDSFSYQWMRDGTVIPGATAASYTPAAADLGGQLTVAATAHKTGFNDATTVSVATDPIAPGTLVAGTPMVTGSPTFGATLTANPGDWSPGSPSFSYQWVSGTTDIVGATFATYSPASSDVGAKLSVRVTGTENGFTPASATSPQTASVGTATFSSAPTPLITGTVAVGQTLVAHPGIWAPGTVSFTYQWAADGTAISGATGSTYVPAAGDLARHLTVTVTGSETGFTDAPSTSAPTIAVAPGTLAPGGPSIVVTGALAYPQTLSASEGTWGPGVVTFTYQWVRDTTDIAGATASTYALLPADVGHRMSVRVTGSKTGYASATSSSAQTAPVASGTIAAAAPTILGTFLFGSTLSAQTGNWTPGNVAFSYQWLRNGTAISGATGANYVAAAADVGTTVSVSVTGSLAGYAPTSAVATGSVVAARTFDAAPTPTISGPSVNHVLTASIADWTPSPDTFAYMWMRDGTVITGASSQKYTLTSADFGKTITVIETVAKAGYATVVTAASVGNGPIVAFQPRFSNSVIPSISGDTTIGEVLTASTGTWSPTPDSFVYVWQRGTGDPTASPSGYTTIPGATSATYQLVAADLGESIVVRVTAVKSGIDPQGSTATSLATDPADPGMLTSVRPTISGTGRFGSQLTAVTGNWGPNPTPNAVTFSYQWRSNGVVIPGASSATFLPRVADIGSSISVRVTGSEPGYSDSIQDSTVNPTITVGVFGAPQAVPTISGTARVGSVLASVDPTWSPTTTYAHQWYADGVAIAGATASSYIPTSDVEGRAISVRVTSLLPGFTTTSTTSAETADVAEGVFTTVPRPTIDGTARVGSTLTAKTEGWVPAITSFSYLWKTGTTVLGSGETLTVPSAALSKTITVTVSSNAAGYPLQVAPVSKPTARIVSGVFVAPSTTITGAVRVGTQLTATGSATWAPLPSKISYQWLRGGVAISKATRSTYTPTSSDYRHALSVRITGSRSAFTTLVRTSRASTVGAGILAAATPTITGTAQVGQVLTAHHTTWGSSVTYRYQWYRSGVAISGATGSTYTLPSSAKNAPIAVRVTGSKKYYTTVSRTSDPTTAVIAGEFTTVGTPSIRGTVAVGSKLSASAGSWAPTSYVTFTYQWFRASAQDAMAVAIPGAVMSSRTLTTDDRGLFLTIVVTAVRAGFSPASASTVTATAAT